MRYLIKQNLSKGSIIYVSGQLGGNIQKTTEQQIRQSSFIRASNIIIKERLHSSVASENVSLEDEFIAERMEKQHLINEHVLNGPNTDMTSEPDLSLDWTEEELIAEQKHKEQERNNEELDNQNIDGDITQKKKDEIE